MGKGSSSSSGGGGRGLRLSVRRLLYSSPLITRRLGGSAPVPPPVHASGQPQACRRSRTSKHQPAAPGASSEQLCGDKWSRSSVDPLPFEQSSPQVSASAAPSETKIDMGESDLSWECLLCLQELPPQYFPQLSTCSHRSCYDCFQMYLRIEILESRITIACPQCSESMHPNDIRMIVNDRSLYERYEDFMVRRVLAIEPDARWCPAPDCTYAVIASGCASCPKIKCCRPGCGSYFCYHCKAIWHPNQTCDAARAQRSPNNNLAATSSLSFSQDSSQHHREDIKPCPRCHALVVKMDDGSCNHMICSLCSAEFCWLCMKQISDLHYLSPSGCTFWGKKPWSRKKKILWQLGTLVGAPVGIAFLAGIAVPAIIIGIPVWVGRKLFNKYERVNKHKRNLIVAGGVASSMLISPVIAALSVSVGVPILLFYVYGVVPVSLCRSSGCGLTASPTLGVKLDFHTQGSSATATPAAVSEPPTQPSSQPHHFLFDGECASHKIEPSIGEASLEGSGSQVEREVDRESAVALAGSIASGAAASCLPAPNHRLEVQADVLSCKRLSLSSAGLNSTASSSTSSLSPRLRHNVHLQLSPHTPEGSGTGEDSCKVVGVFLGSGGTSTEEVMRSLAAVEKQVGTIEFDGVHQLGKNDNQLLSTHCENQAPSKRDPLSFFTSRHDVQAIYGSESNIASILHPGQDRPISVDSISLNFT